MLIYYDEASGAVTYTLTREPGASLAAPPGPHIEVDIQSLDPSLWRVEDGRLVARDDLEEVMIAALRERRAAAFRAEADPVAFKVLRGEATQAEYLAVVAAIRARYPYD